MEGVDKTTTPGLPPVSNSNSPLQPLSSAVQTRMQLLFDSEMGEAAQYGKPYQNTAVLLLSWMNSDLNTRDEVAKLKAVFHDDYNFHVEERLLNKKGGPQKQLNNYLAQFVSEHDNENSLLIIYYAGHGWQPKSNPNEFKLLERTTQEAFGHKHNEVAWLASERILDGAEGDVLGIFDCCHAGSLCRYRGPPRFEYLGACASEQTTPGPGRNSFTSALIWALTELRTGRPFPTSALQQKITKAPFFPPNQYPHLGQRLEPARDHIMIAVQEKDDVDNENPFNEPKPIGLSYYFDLRIHVSEMHDDLIKRWAQAMKALRSDKDLNAERINFHGMKPPDARLLQPLQQWQWIAHSKSSSTFNILALWWLDRARLAIKTKKLKGISSHDPPTPSSSSQGETLPSSGSSETTEQSKLKDSRDTRRKSARLKRKSIVMDNPQDEGRKRSSKRSARKA